MARKSRRIITEQTVLPAPKVQTMPTAIYARLSVENSGKPEAVDVIANQIEICKSYVSDRPDLELLDVYSDNGRTGTVFDRPEFNRLMDDIRSGRIKALVVRDLSRFGRDYIEAGTYLERIFPQIGLRYISIKEHYDSFAADGENEDLLIPLQNMVNSLYSKDISRKVSTALKAQMEQGTFRKRNLPYGYMWNEDHTNMVVDEGTAEFVRLIFQWKMDGLSINKILDRLGEMDAPNPEKRKYEVGTRKGACTRGSGWHNSTIYGILTNPHYVGDTVLGRSESAIYRGTKQHMVHDSEKWIVFSDTHEAIISREDFAAVKEIMSQASRFRQNSITEHALEHAKLTDLFTGKIVCADCGGRMYFHRKQMDKKGRPWYAYYECSTHVKKRYGSCSRHYLRSDNLEVQVLAAIQIQAKTALDYETLIAKLRDSPAERSIRDRQNAEISSLTLKRNSLSKKRARLYADYADGVLDEEEYSFAKKSYDSQFAGLTKLLEETVLRRNRFQEAMSDTNRWIVLMKSVSGTAQLTQELVDAAIERVLVHEGGEIELVMRYSDIYADTVQSVKEIRAEANQYG